MERSDLEKNPTWLPVVAAALRDAEGRCLMHRRPFEKHHGGLWEFPGGKVEEGENPRNALVREIEEELGIRLEGGNLVPAGFADGKPDVSAMQIVILLYTTTDWEGTPQALEGEAIGWFTPDEVLTLDKPPLDIALARALFEKEAK